MSIHHAMILLLYLIISLLIAQSPSAAVDKQFQACSTTLYNCGSMRGVGYPFLGDGHPSFCGKFNLTCTDDKSFIGIEGNTFRVLQIDQSNSLMKIVREDLWNHTCPASFTNVALPNYESFNYGGTVTNINIFYGCASEVANKNLNITCPVKGESGVLFQDARAAFVDRCKTSILVPISLKAFRGIQQGGLTLRDAVNQGFDVNYHVHQSCSACKASGGACGSGPENQFVCFCPDEPQPWVCHSGMFKPQFIIVCLPGLEKIEMGFVPELLGFNRECPNSLSIYIPPNNDSLIAHTVVHCHKSQIGVGENRGMLLTSPSVVFSGLWWMVWRGSELGNRWLMSDDWPPESKNRRVRCHS